MTERPELVLRASSDIVYCRFEAAVAFYRDLLGLESIGQWDGGARFHGGCGRELTLRRGKASDDERPAPYGRHTGVGFEAADLRRTFDALVDRGVRFASAPCSQPWGGSMVNLIDPDGRLVVLLESAATARARSGATTILAA